MSVRIEACQSTRLDSMIRPAVIAGSVIALLVHLLAMFTMGWLTVFWVLFVAGPELIALAVAYALFFRRVRRSARPGTLTVLVIVGWIGLVAPIVLRPIVTDQEDTTGVLTLFSFSEHAESSAGYERAFWVVLASLATVIVSSVAVAWSLRGSKLAPIPADGLST